MTKIVVYKKDVPENRPCHVYIENQLGLVNTMKSLTPRYSGKYLLKFKLDWDFEKVLADIWSATYKHKWWGWVNKNAESILREEDKLKLDYEGSDFIKRGSYYGGWSIKSNPTYCQAYGITPEAAGMGELPSPISWFLFSAVGSDHYRDLEESNQMLMLTRTAVQYGYRAMIDKLAEMKIIPEEKIKTLSIPEPIRRSIHKEKNSYFDTWSYTEWTDAAIDSGIHDLLGNTTCQVLRSRVAWQRGAFRNYRVKPSENDKYTWHSDEHMVHNLRINIPIKTSAAFGLEIKDQSPVLLEERHAYTWDSNIVHRQIQVDNSSTDDRINMIIGFNPWFDWDQEQQAWVSNEFYGKIHPLDMALEGLIIPGLKFIKEEVR